MDSTDNYQTAFALTAQVGRYLNDGTQFSINAKPSCN